MSILVRLYLFPSIQADTRKGDFPELENSLEDPLREGENLGASMPTLPVWYHLCQTVQSKNKELRGMVQVLPTRIQQSYCCHPARVVRARTSG